MSSLSVRLGQALVTAARKEDEYPFIHHKMDGDDMVLILRRDIKDEGIEVRFGVRKLVHRTTSVVEAA